jgi:hypothetical protein
MNAKQVTGWAGAVVAIGAAVAVVLGPVQTSMRSLIAQEAAAEVQKQMQPTAQKLSSIEDLLRRDIDFKLLQSCLETRTTFRCRQESEHRWATWTWGDCRAEKGEDHPSCVKPEPLGDP